MHNRRPTSLPPPPFGGVGVRGLRLSGRVFFNTSSGCPRLPDERCRPVWTWGLSIFLCLLILFLEIISSRRPSYFWSYFWKDDHISTDHTSHLRDRCGDESGAVHRMHVCHAHINKYVRPYGVCTRPPKVSQEPHHCQPPYIKSNPPPHPPPLLHHTQKFTRPCNLKTP